MWGTTMLSSLKKKVLEPASRSSSPPLVLIADDDAEVRALAVAMLSVRGISVMTASDGLEALTLCRTRKPDVLFLDLHMHPANGVEVMRLLRADARTADIVVVGMTTMPLERTAHPDASLAKTFLEKSEVLAAMPRYVADAFVRRNATIRQEDHSDP